MDGWMIRWIEGWMNELKMRIMNIKINKNSKKNMGRLELK